MKSIRKENKDMIEYLNEQGERHREDGPAVEFIDGYKAWYINGDLHREDGPARVWQSGDKDWYLNGQMYSEQVWEQKVTELKLKRILDL
jgi:hypothetical protein